MILGYAMREEQGIWQDSLGLNSSYGLKGELAGNLSHFFTALSALHETLQQAHSIEKMARNFNRTFIGFLRAK